MPQCYIISDKRIDMVELVSIFVMLTFKIKGEKENDKNNYKRSN